MKEDDSKESGKTLNHLLRLVSGKKVFLATHWDADGVTSAAMIYHLIKDHCNVTGYVSKGEVFLIKKEDVDEGADIIIVTDIQADEALPQSKIVYIDHHPLKNEPDFALKIHNPKAVSASMLIWDTLIPESKDPYLFFLALIGYLGDNGKIEELDEGKRALANELFPELMEKRASRFSDYYYVIQRYVSMMNIGKRYFWNGELPLAMLMSASDYREIVNNSHPIAGTLNKLRMELREDYNASINKNEINGIEYAIITNNKNVQGVLCARYMKDKPIIVMNIIDGKVIGSMRVPDSVNFDAGEFLSSINPSLDNFRGGGHEKAGGFTFNEESLSDFLRVLSEKAAKESANKNTS